MKLIILLGSILGIALVAPVQAKQNSFAQKDMADHLLAFLTEGEDLPDRRNPSFFGLPNTGLVYSVISETDRPALMRFEGQGELTRDIPLSLIVEADEQLSPWPMYVQLNAETPERGYIFLLGVVVERREGYSGGEASEHWLHLFRVDNPGADHGRAREVLKVPLAGDKIIRACFTEQDETARQGVCHDSYQFEAILRLDEDHAGDWPQLIYRTSAASRPGMLISGITMPDRPLTTEQLAKRTDFGCSFERALRFNPISRRYEMQTPWPVCSEYLLPSPDESTSLCRANSVAVLAGQTRINDEAARQFTGASVIRQIGPGDAMTEDFRRDRVTIETNSETGRIVRAFCG